MKCKGPCQMPEWVIDGWYANNPFAQQMAIARWHVPKTTPEEREAVRVFNRARGYRPPWLPEGAP